MICVFCFSAGPQGRCARLRGHIESLLMICVFCFSAGPQGRCTGLRGHIDDLKPRQTESWSSQNRLHQIWTSGICWKNCMFQYFRFCVVCNGKPHVAITYAGIGITFFSMCQMAPSILFQWDISNFNGPFDNLNAPKGRKWDMAFKCICVWCGFNNGVVLSAYCLVHVLHAKSMVITYVYAKNSAPRADRGFLNDVQNTNSNCDITMWAGIYNFLMHRGVSFDWNSFL